MDVLAEKINKFFGVYPNNIRRRVSVAIMSGVIGAIAIMFGFLYTFSNFTTTIISNGLRETTYAAQNIGIFLMFLYVLFIGSLVYYVFLPWRSKEKNY